MCLLYALISVFIVCGFVLIVLRLSLYVQTGERTVKENGKPEAQGANREEQKCPADGGCQEERGQSERKFPADKGLWRGKGGERKGGRYNWEV